MQIRVTGMRNVQRDKGSIIWIFVHKKCHVDVLLECPLPTPPPDSAEAAQVLFILQA